MEFIDNSNSGFLIFARSDIFLLEYKQGTYVLTLSPIRFSLSWSRAAIECTYNNRDCLTEEGCLKSRSEYLNN